MKNSKKLILWVTVADLLLLIVLFVLCAVADGMRKSNDKSKNYVDDEIDGLDGSDFYNASFAIGEHSVTVKEKSKVFGSDIYGRAVIPSGEAMGIYMKTDGVMVVDVCSFKGVSGKSYCPVEDILRTGDYITGINGKSISKRSELLSMVSASDGKSLDIEYIRDGKTYHDTVTPQANENGNYLLGAWVKDDVSGIGTITFIDENNFMALGHSVSDVDTGLMMRCSTGGMYTTNITNICKSYSEQPGRLQGSIAYRKALVGIIDGNSSSGIYGHLDETYCSSKYSDAERMYIARGVEVHSGSAYIYSRMNGTLSKYEIDIEIVDSDAADKNIEFHVTDSNLLELTGGVVQGMSGSPIVQDGKIIGAVTHVFVNDPTRGYGIFIENMLAE